MGHAARLVLVCAAAAACGEDAQPAASPTPAPSEPLASFRPLPAGTTVEEAIVLLARDALESTLSPTSAGDDVGIDDETPRMDTEREPPGGCVWTFLHSAGVHVPVRGLDSVALSLDEDGLLLTLRYGADEMVLHDAGRSPGAAATFAELRRAGADAWESVWPAVVDEVRRWAHGAGLKAGALDAALAVAEAEHGSAVEAFSRDAESLHRLYRNSLRATFAPPPDDLASVYRDHALRIVRRRLAAAATEPAGEPVRPVASGPCEGVVRGDPAAGSGSVMLAGADDVLVRLFVRRDGGTLDEAGVTQTLRSFRPYAPGPEDVGAIGASKTAAGGVLVALSRFHLGPTVASAKAFVRAYTSQPAARDAERLERLVSAIAAHHGFDPAATATLLPTVTDRR